MTGTAHAYLVALGFTEEFHRVRDFLVWINNGVPATPGFLWGDNLALDGDIKVLGDGVDHGLQGIAAARGLTVGSDERRTRSHQ